MHEEMELLEKNNTWEVVQLSPSKKACLQVTVDMSNIEVEYMVVAEAYKKTLQLKDTMTKHVLVSKFELC